jgi:hypothetical protein
LVEFVAAGFDFAILIWPTNARLIWPIP